MKSLKHKLMIFLTKGLFKRVKVPMWFPLCWCMKKMDLEVCVLIAKLSTTFLFMRKQDSTKGKEWNNMKDKLMKVINGWYLIQEDGFGYT